jgi:hypothetical protein
VSELFHVDKRFSDSPESAFSRSPPAEFSGIEETSFESFGREKLDFSMCLNTDRGCVVRSFGVFSFEIIFPARAPVLSLRLFLQRDVADPQWLRFSRNHRNDEVALSRRGAGRSRSTIFLVYNSSHKQNTSKQLNKNKRNQQKERKGRGLAHSHPIEASGITGNSTNKEINKVYRTPTSWPTCAVSRTRRWRRWWRGRKGKERHSQGRKGRRKQQSNRINSSQSK